MVHFPWTVKCPYCRLKWSLRPVDTSTAADSQARYLYTFFGGTELCTHNYEAVDNLEPHLTNHKWLFCALWLTNTYYMHHMLHVPHAEMQHISTCRDAAHVYMLHTCRDAAHVTCLHVVYMLHTAGFSHQQQWKVACNQLSFFTNSPTLINHHHMTQLRHLKVKGASN